MQSKELENIRKQFGGFSKMIQNDAEHYIENMFPEAVGTTIIIVAQTKNSIDQSKEAYHRAQRYLSPFLNFGFLHASRSSLESQLDCTNDFVFACALKKGKQVLQKTILDMYNDTGRLGSNSHSFPDTPDLNYQFDWRAGLGVSVHSAYIALSHARANEFLLDNAFRNMPQEQLLFEI